MKVVKGFFYILLAGFFLVVTFIGMVQAAPNLINYQGYLEDGSGPVNGAVAMDVALYDADTDGNIVWSETHTSVAVTDGVYHLILGSGTPDVGTFSADIFNNPDLWLQITVGTEDLSPRQKLASVPYAMNASMAQTVTAGSITGASIAPGSITETELAAGSVTPEKLSSAVCAEGETLVQTAAGWECRVAEIYSAGSVQKCYDGEISTANVGECKEGSRLWGPTGPGTCEGQVTPAGRTCNTKDNDCDGLNECYWRYTWKESASTGLVAASKSGKAIIVTGSGGNSIYAEVYSNGSLSGPVLISPVQFNNSGVDIAMADNGDAIVVWAQNDEAMVKQIFMAEYRNGNWITTTDLTAHINPEGSVAGNPDVAMDDNGNAIIVWSQTDGVLGYRTYVSEYRDGVWHHPATLDEHIGPYQAKDWVGAPKVAMADNGEAVIAWGQEYNDFNVAGFKPRLYISEYRNGAWSHPATRDDFINPDGNVSNQSVAMDDNGNTIIVWEQSPYLLMSEYRNGSWTHPGSTYDHFNPDGQFPFTGPGTNLAMGGNGDAIIVWMEVESPDKNRIYRSEYRNGAWHHPANLADATDPGGTYINYGDKPFAVMDDNGNALIAWTQAGYIYKLGYFDGSWIHYGAADDPSLSASTGFRLAMDNNSNALIVYADQYPKLMGTDVWGNPAYMTRPGRMIAEMVYDMDSDLEGVPFDCNDTDPSINTGATEIGGDGIDSNCDGLDYPDIDGDGFGSDTDCDDTDPARFPGNPEICDGLDNDCNTIVDENCPCDYLGDPDGVCANGTINPGNGLCFPEPPSYEATESLCDGLDNDCDGVVDIGCDAAFEPNNDSTTAFDLGQSSSTIIINDISCDIDWFTLTPLGGRILFALTSSAAGATVSFYNPGESLIGTFPAGTSTIDVFSGVPVSVKIDDPGNTCNAYELSLAIKPAI